MYGIDETCKFTESIRNTAQKLLVSRHQEKIIANSIHGHVTDVEYSDMRHCRGTSRNYLTLSLAPR